MSDQIRNTLRGALAPLNAVVKAAEAQQADFWESVQPGDWLIITVNIDGYVEDMKGQFLERDQKMLWIEHEGSRHPIPNYRIEGIKKG